MARGDNDDVALRIELIAGIDLPDRAAWDDLAAAASCTNICYEHRTAAAAVLPEAARSMILAAWLNQAKGPRRFAGFLPLQRRTVLGGKFVVALQNWDNRARALGEPLIRAGHEGAFWTAALDSPIAQPRLGHYLRLSALVADSPSTRALHDMLVTRGRRAYVTRSFERALLRLGPSAADCIAANIRQKALKEQRRLRNRLEEGGLTLDRLAVGEAIEPMDRRSVPAGDERLERSRGRSGGGGRADRAVLSQPARRGPRTQPAGFPAAQRRRHGDRVARHYRGGDGDHRHHDQSNRHKLNVGLRTRCAVLTTEALL